MTRITICLFKIFMLQYRSIRGSNKKSGCFVGCYWKQQAYSATLQWSIWSRSNVQGIVLNLCIQAAYLCVLAIFFFFFFCNQFLQIKGSSGQITGFWCSQWWSAPLLARNRSFSTIILTKFIVLVLLIIFEINTKTEYGLYV